MEISKNQSDRNSDTTELVQYKKQAKFTLNYSFTKYNFGKQFVILLCIQTTAKQVCGLRCPLKKEYSRIFHKESGEIYLLVPNGTHWQMCYCFPSVPIHGGYELL